MALPNLRLSSAVLGGLAQPDFARAAGLSIGAGMLGAQRRADEAETRATQEASIELLRKAQVAQETGDMGMLTGLTNELDALLSSTQNEQSRQIIMDSLNTVQGQRAATQSQAQTNTAMSIIKTEQALQNFKNQTGPLSDQELAVQKTLQDRLAMMKQNGAAVAEAATIQFKADSTALEREAELRTKRVEAGKAVLASLDPDSDQYKKAVSSLEANGLGQAVRHDKTMRREATKANLEIKEIESKVGPLSKTEIAWAEENGVQLIPGDDALNRKIYNNARTKKVELELEQRFRSISTPEKPRAEGIAKAQLGMIARQGDFFDIPFYRDIATKIEDMSEEQTADLMGRIAGLSEEEIPNEVNAWLYENFPKEMERSAVYAEKNRMDAEDIGRLTNQILIEKGIDVSAATEEQRAVAQREAQLAIQGAESALQRQQAPASGGEGRRERRGPSQVAEPYTIERRTGTGGQMNRRQKP